jgi:hypothetical protein
VVWQALEGCLATALLIPAGSGVVSG